MGKGKTGQEMMLNQPDIHTENVTSLNSLKKKKNLRWIIDLNVSPKL